MYANESKGQKFPPNRYAAYDCDLPTATCTNRTDFDFMFQGNCVYAEYLTEVKILLCPLDGSWDYDFERFHCEWDTTQPCPCRWNSRSYNYCGFLMLPETLLLDPANMNAPVPSYSMFKTGAMIALATIGVEKATVALQQAG